MVAEEWLGLAGGILGASGEMEWRGRFGMKKQG